MLQIGEHVAVGEHRPFGRARRAARVLQEGDVIRRELDPGQWALCPTLHGVEQRYGFRDVPFGHHFLDVLDEAVDQPALGCGDEVADLGADDVADRGLREHFLKGVSEVFQNDDGTGAGVLHLGFEFAGGVERVDVHYRQSGAQDAKQGDGVLQQVGHHDRHAVTLR